MAQGHVLVSPPFLRAEALRLYLLWQESLHAACHTCDQREERANVLAALRKRTIQVLVRMSVPRPGPGRTAPDRP